MAIQNPRRSQRFVTVGIGEIVSADGWGSGLCSIYNISNHGAMIALPDEYVFPKQFMFRKIATNEMKPARVVWRNIGLAGIEFIHAP